MVEQGNADGSYAREASTHQNRGGQHNRSAEAGSTFYVEDKKLGYQQRHDARIACDLAHGLLQYLVPAGARCNLC